MLNEQTKHEGKCFHQCTCQNKTLNYWAREIHELAVLKGHWEKEESFSDYLAQCHAELSEAFEEDRAGTDDYYICGATGKPEGRAVEMIDCVMMILDWCGAKNIDVDAIMSVKHEYNKTRPYRHSKR